MRHTYVLLIGFLWLVSGAGAINVDSLLVKSVGGPAARDSLKKMTSYVAEGSVSINGNPGTFREVFVPPQKLYLEVNLGSFKLIQAYDGVNAWQQDHNGSVTALQGLEREELLEQVFFESYAYLFPDRMAGKIEYRGDTTYDGVRAHVAVIALPGADSVTVFFDSDSGLRRYMTSRVDNTEIVTTISDYRTVQGVQVPFHSNAVAVDAPITSEFRISRCAFNEPVDSSLFRRPDRQVSDFHFPKDQDYVRIPIEYHAGHIYVPVTVNGTKRLKLILDSGASANMLHEPAVADLQLPKIGSLPAKGLANYDEITLVRVDSMAIGDLRLYNQVSGKLDLGGVGFKNPTDGDFGGILGYDFLSRFPIMLDYVDSSLVVYNPERFEPPAGGSEIPFTLTLQVPTVKVTVDHVPGEFIIDLGNAFGLILHQSFVNRPELAKSLHDVEPLPAVVSGVGGGLSGKMATVDSVTIGDQVKLSSVRVMLMESAGGMAGSSRLAGNIGNLILQSFRVLFDYSHQRLFFYPADTHP